MMLVFGVLFFGALSSPTVAQDVYVEVQQGTLRGAVVPGVLGTQYISFRGIPYVQPPLGELRFQAPLPAESWEGVHDALEESPACLQAPLPDPMIFGPTAEDCLYLNVYVPLNLSEPAPVLVWLHGGGFIVGSGGSGRFKPDLFIQQGVAVVTINYRLGALGFLSTQDEVIPGNAGMKDQLMALQWVQHNIAAFGGDPDKVTVGGDSGGGSSASHHFISSVSAGLFRSVVIHSGKSTSPFGVRPQPRPQAFRLGEVLGLSTNDSQELLDFLKTQDGQELMSHDDDLLTDVERVGISNLVWAPVVEADVEGAFITDWPYNNLKAGRFNRVSVLEGRTSADGLTFLNSSIGKPYLSDPAALQELNDNFVEVVAPVLHLPTAAQREEAALKLRDFYFGNQTITEDDAQAIVDMITDIYFADPTDSIVRIVTNHSDARPLYYYQFDYRGPEVDNSTYGTRHVAETDILFLYIGELFPDPNSAFSRMRRNLVRLWANFIRHGTPSPDGEPILWPPFLNSDLHYMHITDDFQLSRNVDQQRMDFWHQNVPW